MAFTTRREAPEAEAARLAQSPVGSLNHILSTMPVNIHGDLLEKVIELPQFNDEPAGKVIVVPIERHPYKPAEEADDLLLRRYNCSWTCIVIASSHPGYIVGGYRLSIPEHQLVRGHLRTFDL
ncbi:hypothetical protein ANMWB30_23920 [Arthrobacter sp. MWB30]|nr:hypothetical protein ANMWB30_23920 [Arthrobacter sp. MWB30]